MDEAGAREDARSTDGSREDLETRVRAGYDALVAALTTRDPSEPDVIGLRADLAVAVAEAGQLEEAVYQVDELVRDAGRAHGPEHAATRRARAAQDEVRRLAGFAPEG